MKNLYVIFVLAAALVCNATAQAQTFYEENDFNEGFTIKYKGKRPTIVDFVTAIENSWEENPEFLGDAHDAWKNYLRGRKINKNETLTVDVANGYVSYEQRNNYDGSESDGVKEYCFWNCNDKRYKLVAENVYFYYEGKYFEGQYNGITFYLYDSVRRKMTHLANNFSIFEIDDKWFADSEGNYHPVEYNLPQKGKDITVKIHATNGTITKMLHWNGKGFDTDN